jgi:hypothetical protein
VSETPGLSFALLGGLGNGGWRGALRIVQRQAPLRGKGLGEGSGKLGWGLPAEAGVGPFGVIVRAPGGQRGAGMVQGREQSFIQQLVPQAAVEAFDEGSLGRLARGDVVPVKLAVIHELQDSVRGELGSIITDHRLGLSTGVKQRGQFSRHPKRSLNSTVNLATFLRCIELPEAMADWSLTSLQLKLIKIGARVVRHARAITFHLAEVAVTGSILRAILAAIQRLRAPPSCA